MGRTSALLVTVATTLALLPAAGTAGAAARPPQEDAPQARVWVTTPDGTAKLSDQGTVAFHRGGPTALTITVDPSRTYQRLEGFGASITGPDASQGVHWCQCGTDMFMEPCRAVARQAVAESQVLLKNSGHALPLSKKASVYVAGSNADDIGNQAGGWTIQCRAIRRRHPGRATILQRIENTPSGDVTYSKDASAPVGDAEVGIVVVGETPYAEGFGDVRVPECPTPCSASARSRGSCRSRGRARSRKSRSTSATAPMTRCSSMDTG